MARPGYITYVILENHLHLIAQSSDLKRDVARFKSFTAKQVIACLIENNVKVILDQLAFYRKAHKDDRTYQLWEEGVHRGSVGTRGWGGSVGTR